MFNRSPPEACIRDLQTGDLTSPSLNTCLKNMEKEAAEKLILLFLGGKKNWKKKQHCKCTVITINSFRRWFQINTIF